MATTEKTTKTMIKDGVHYLENFRKPWVVTTGDLRKGNYVHVGASDNKEDAQTMWNLHLLKERLKNGRSR